jgi:hypothetical protein
MGRRGWQYCSMWFTCERMVMGVTVFLGRLDSINPQASPWPSRSGGFCS